MCPLTTRDPQRSASRWQRKRKKEVYGIITTEIPSILTIFLIDVRTPGYRGQGNAETDRDLTRGEVYATLLMELKMRQ